MELLLLMELLLSNVVLRWGNISNYPLMIERRYKSMNVRNTTVTAIAVAALSTFFGAGQANAQNFTFTSIFTDNTHTSGTTTLTITNGQSLGLIGTPTNIVLSNLGVFTTPGTGPNTFLNDPYSTTLTIFDQATGTHVSHQFTGFFNGTADGGVGGNAASSTFTETPTTLSQNYVFATGTYTVTRSGFVSPGPFNNGDGSQGAFVTFTPAAAVPEPGAVASLLIGGSLLGLMAFRRRSGFKAAF